MQVTVLKAVNNTLQKGLENPSGKKLTPEQLDQIRQDEESKCDDKIKPIHSQKEDLDRKTQDLQQKVKFAKLKQIGGPDAAKLVALQKSIDGFVQSV